MACVHHGDELLVVGLDPGDELPLLAAGHAPRAHASRRTRGTGGGWIRRRRRSGPRHPGRGSSAPQTSSLKRAVLVLECSVGGCLLLQRRQCPEPRVRLAQHPQAKATDDDEDNHHDREGDEELGADPDGYPRHETRQPVDGPRLHVLVLSGSGVASVIGGKSERLAHHCHVPRISRLGCSAHPSSINAPLVGAADRQRR